MESARNNEWDVAAVQSPDGGLLQSSAWGAFQEALGRRVEFVKFQSPISNLQSLIVEHRLPLGFSYVYSPRGPVVYALSEVEVLQGASTSSANDLGGSLSALTNEVRRRFPKAIFWCIEPPLREFRIQNLESRIVKSARDVQPATTLVIDLTKSEDELLAAMKQKTRYNIGVAQRHGITVRSSLKSSSLSDEDCGRFLGLLEETARRDGFRAHPRRHYELLLGARSLGVARDDGVVLVVAEHEDMMLAGAMIAFFGQWAYYLHGASSSDNRALMAPCLLHWEIMREAKRRGCTRYDLWGISPSRRDGISNDKYLMSNDRLAGVTRFKLGFAPNTKPTTFAGTWDMVLRPRIYRIYRLLRR